MWRRNATRRPITIVAIGSSSTAGAGASTPAANYPSRLQAELKQRFPGHTITVLNRGVNGEEIADMLKRFDTAVVAAKPDLVIWQLGTNSVIRDHQVVDHGASIRTGLDRIRTAGADVVLIDPQFAPKVIAKPEAAHMVELIATTAKRKTSTCSRRFDVMKRWRESITWRSSRSCRPTAAHERLELCLHGQGPRRGDRRSRERPVMSAAMSRGAVSDRRRFDYFA